MQIKCIAPSINRFERVDLRLREPAELEGELRLVGVAVVCDQLSISPSMALTAHRRQIVA